MLGNEYTSVINRQKFCETLTEIRYSKLVSLEVETGVFPAIHWEKFGSACIWICAPTESTALVSIYQKW